MRANLQWVESKTKRDTAKASVGEAAPKPPAGGGGDNVLVLGMNGGNINPFAGSGFGGFGIDGAFSKLKGAGGLFSTKFGGGMFGNGVKIEWVSGSQGAGGSLSLQGFRVSFG